MGGNRDDAPGDQGRVIQIELRLDGSMPAGVATAPGCAVHDFTGWMGLMAAVDALTSGDDNHATGDDEP
jgi:hypothetical protein